MTKQTLWEKITLAACALKSVWLDLVILQRLIFAMVILLFGGSLADAQAVPFAPLHIYYISPTGNDANAGTSSSKAWATPHHPVQCGDVIIAAAGSYGEYIFGVNSWGAVSNCPSTKGGIDGTGGIYFATLLCAGPRITSCSVNGGAHEAFRVTELNWAVEGFTATQNSTATGGCYIATSNTSATLHHIAFVNDIAINCDYGGFGTYSWTPPGGGRIKPQLLAPFLIIPHRVPAAAEFVAVGSRLFQMMARIRAPELMCLLLDTSGTKTSTPRRVQVATPMAKD